MKALIIGGTGTISAAISRKLIKLGWELWLINRGSRREAVPDRCRVIQCDIENEADCAAELEGNFFDTVADFIVYTPAQAQRDYRLFKNITKQYIMISSASVYQKPPSNYLISEAELHSNPFWEYSRNKIACEDFFISKHKEEGFPVTIVLPSHTYDERNIPVGIHGKKGSWQVIKRMLEGKKIIIHGDGSSLWTMTSSEDFADGFVGLMGNTRAYGESFLITSNESLTWNQIYSTIADALGVPLKAVHIASEFLHEAGPYDLKGSLIGDKANSVVFDNSKLKRFVPEFCAKTSFAQGVRKSLEYVLAHKECQKEDDEFDAWCDRIISAQEKALELCKT